MYTFGIVFLVDSQEGYNGAQAWPWSPGRGTNTTHALGATRPLCSPPYTVGGGDLWEVGTKAEVVGTHRQIHGFCVSRPRALREDKE
jgi:hypothetical protein